MQNQRRFWIQTRHAETFFATARLTWRLSLIVTILLLASCREQQRGEERELRTSEPQREGIVRLTAAQAQSAGIKVEPAADVSMPDFYSTIGRVVPRAGGQAELFAPFPGRLIVAAPPPLQIGRRVKRDEVLFQVEQEFSAAETLQLRTSEAELQGRIEEAEQELVFARKEYARAQKLFEAGAIPEKQLLGAELAARQAQTRLESARKTKAQYEQAAKPNESIRRAPIRSPISGVVTRMDFAAGQQVDPAKSLATVTDMERVWVEAPVQERELSRIGRAAHAQVMLPGEPDGQFPGQRVWSGQVVDPLNRTVPIVFAVANREGVLKLGMSTEVRIPRGGSTSRLAVPRSALVSHGAASIVFCETANNVFERRAVAIGPSSGPMVAILEGLKKGDRVVTQGAQSLLGESSKGLIPAEEEE